ncbi:hypothetical protein SAMN05421753_1224 [Planctomicrobium piriforme]|uniref:Uncharacterized protein n=1 Tax=Planctomicrobium piriforme TaxID=1576369 RepID=A0A1I3RVW4_9PLAN|nr:hypothetical protein SAMN05421753_1224 [Planctomicrobium piriforme]
MIFDMPHQLLLMRVQRRPFPHGPGLQRSIEFQAKVIVQPARLVLLNDVEQLPRLERTATFRRFCRLVAIALFLYWARLMERASAGGRLLRESFLRSYFCETAKTAAHCCCEGATGFIRMYICFCPGLLKCEPFSSELALSDTGGRRSAGRIVAARRSLHIMFRVFSLAVASANFVYDVLVGSFQLGARQRRFRSRN